LAGADVAVFSKDGRLLFEKMNATNVRGIYPVKLMNLPKDFGVVVTDVNPNVSNRFNLGQVVLSADVRNYNPVKDVVYVNPVTTMVTGILLRRPEFSVRRPRRAYGGFWPCLRMRVWERRCVKPSASTPLIFRNRPF
jgi:hypothetical protein